MSVGVTQGVVSVFLRDRLCVSMIWGANLGGFEGGCCGGFVEEEEEDDDDSIGCGSGRLLEVTALGEW